MNLQIPISASAAEKAGLKASKTGLYAVRREKPNGSASVRNFSDDFFTLNPQMRDGALHLFLNDEIDQWFGIGPEHLQNALANAEEEFGAGVPVVMHLNSPGGSVFDAVAMSALLAGREGGFEARVEGMAASAATFLLMSADKRTATTLSQVMVHRASTIAWGNAEDLGYTAKLLDAIDADIADMYAKRAGMDVEDVRGLMEAETYMTAQDALDAGFVDEVVELAKPKAKPEASTRNKHAVAVLASSFDIAA